jgi:hypothetical protein
MGPIEALKGMVKLGGGLIGGTFKLVGKGVSSLVGVVSPGAKQWLDQTGQNFVDGFKNWGGSIANSADLGKIGNLKKMLINLFTKFAFALHKKMVAQAKDTGEKIAGTKNAIASGKNSIVNSKVDAKQVQQSMEASKKGKSVDNILNKATAKTNAINKTNQSIGLGSVDKTPTLRR